MNETQEQTPFYRSSIKGKTVGLNQACPISRDGHFADIYKDNLIIFGGDRHCVAFNDLHYLKLKLAI